jgi:hypothetical protein
MWEKVLKWMRGNERNAAATRPCRYSSRYCGRNCPAPAGFSFPQGCIIENVILLPHFICIWPWDRPFADGLMPDI